jgi:D-amino-acid dehydrogenase
MRVVVIGGGAIGLCCAYSLLRDGAEVVVLERDRVGMGASRGNTGWLCPVLSAPLPAPGVMGTALRGMLRPSRSPVLIRPLVGPSFLRWSWGFWRACTPERYRRGLGDTLALGADCFDRYDALRAAGVAVEVHAAGMLVAATGDAGLAEYATMLDEARAGGYAHPIGRLGGDRARELEPALGEAVVGALRVPAERYVRPESLTDGLAAWLRAGGAEVRERVDVSSLVPTAGRWRVRADGEELEAEAVVVAAGVWSGRLLEGLGVKLPMEAAKGYSITARGTGTLPRHALYLAEGKVGTSTFGDVLRIAGIFDLTGMDTSLRRKRIEEMVRASLPYLRDWRPTDVELEWSGLRPYPSDGLPIVGSVGAHQGLAIATGHGRMGITLAPATGDAVARLLLEGVVEPTIRPFGLERFA